MFTSNKNLSLSGKFLAWYAAVLGTISIVLPFMPSYNLIHPFPYFFTIVSILFGCISIYASYHALGDKVWAFWLLLTLYLIQSVEYFSPGFSASFIGPVSLKFGWVWLSPPKQINFNFVALIVVVIANNNITRHRLIKEKNEAANNSHLI